MTFFEANYAQVSDTVVDFADGAQPGQVTETTATNSSITYTANDGGRATLTTGSSSDEAALRMGSWSAGDYNAVGMSTVLDLTTAAAGGNNCIILIGFDDGDESEYIWHQLNHGSNNRKTVEISGVNGSNQQPTADGRKEGIVKSSLLWDIQRDQLLHRLNDRLVLAMDASALDASETYTAAVRILPKDTSSSISMDVLEMATEFRRQKR